MMTFVGRLLCTSRDGELRVIAHIGQPGNCATSELRKSSMKNDGDSRTRPRSDSAATEAGGSSAGSHPTRALSMIAVARGRPVSK